MKYRLFKGTDIHNIIHESNNKRILIDMCKKLEYSTTVIKNDNYDIVFENKCQKQINNLYGIQQ